MRETRVLWSAGLSLSSFFIFTLVDAGVQHLLKSHHLFQIVMINNGMALLFFMLFLLGIRYMLPQRIPYRDDLRSLLLWKPKKWKWHIILALGSILADLGIFYALTFHTLGEVYVIILVTPIFAAVLAYFFYRERIIALKWCCIIIAFMASIWALNPSFTGVSWALLGVLGASLIYGGGYILIKYHMREEEISAIFISSRGIATLLLLLPAILFWKGFDGGQLLMGAANGLGYFLGFYFIIIATRIGQVSMVSSLQYMQLLFGFIVDLWLYQSYPSFVPLGAGTCITITGLLIVYLDHRLEVAII